MEGFFLLGIRVYYYAVGTSGTVRTGKKIEDQVTCYERDIRMSASQRRVSACHHSTEVRIWHSRVFGAPNFGSMVEKCKSISGPRAYIQPPENPRYNNDKVTGVNNC